MRKYLELSQPLLSHVRFLLTESHVHQLAFFFSNSGEGFSMLEKIGKVLFGIFFCAGTQTLCPVSNEREEMKGWG